MKLEEAIKDKIYEIRERVNRFRGNYIWEADWTDSEVANMLETLLNQSKEEEDV